MNRFKFLAFFFFHAFLALLNSCSQSSDENSMVFNADSCGMFVIDTMDLPIMDDKAELMVDFNRTSPGDTVYKVFYFNASYYLIKELDQFALVAQCNGDKVNEPLMGVPKRFLKKFDDPSVNFDLSKIDHQLVHTKINRVESYYYYLPKGVSSYGYALKLIKALRAVKSNSSNIFLIDSKLLVPLLDKYPLSGSEKVLFGDHLIAMSPFDSPSSFSWYPYADGDYMMNGGIHYSEIEARGKKW